MRCILSHSMRVILSIRIRSPIIFVFALYVTVATIIFVHKFTVLLLFVATVIVFFSACIISSGGRVHIRAIICMASVTHCRRGRDMLNIILSTRRVNMRNR